MDSWIINLLWAIGGLSGLLAAYMACAHHLIHWQRKRGLLARESYGLYWTVLGFFKTYRWLIAVIIFFSAGVGVYTLVVSQPRQVAPSLDTANTSKQPQSTTGDTGRFSEIKTWILRLEDRRVEYPQDYCGRVERGLSAFKQVQQPSEIISLKLRYLNSEYQKHCPSTASK